MSIGLLGQCLSEFDREMGMTGRVLARVPDAHLTWRPHPRSLTLGALAWHVASVPGWLPRIIAESGFDLVDASLPDPDAPQAEGPAAAILGRFEVGRAAARQALVASTDARLLESWTLAKAGQPLLTMPRIVALRAEGLYHLAHHRGQLTVYLRLLDIPLPALYGPSADEGRL